MSKFKEAIEYIQSFPDAERGSSGIAGPTMSLATMKSLLGRLGNPQACARTIHVTGSKGKGSTATLIAAVLKAAAYRTALYTSPHLHSYRERIAFDLQPVSEEEFAEGIGTISALVRQSELEGEGPYSTFGVLTALFFHLAKQRLTKSDWQIVEVGMGGKHDATNVFATKDVAVITAVSLEHTAILGKSIPEIVKNKAGIITPGSTCVLAPQRDARVKAIVQEICDERQAELVDVSTACSFEGLEQSRQGQLFVWQGHDSQDTFSLKLLGQHQMENAATAATVAQVLQKRGASTSRSAMAEGLAQTELPGRFEIISLRADSNGAELPIILDGAHNQDSANALARTLRQLFPDQKCLIIMGVNRDKNIEAMWAELGQYCRMLIATKSENMRAMPPEEIIERCARADQGLSSLASNSVKEALHDAIRYSGKYDLICVTGSLYLVAEAREEILHRQISHPNGRLPRSGRPVEV
jgi:dihydrofolate synthase/folylpolyglutamate synthase